MELTTAKLQETAEAREKTDLLKLMWAMPVHAQEHCVRVGRYTRKLWEVMCGREGAFEVGLAAQFHDIGKAYVSHKLLNKAGTLNEREYEAVKKHVEYGDRLFQEEETITYGGLPLTRDSRERMRKIARCHHEWWDGGGYPDGKERNRIPLEARICALADAYDVMKEGRVYRDRLPEQEIYAELVRNAGRQFDPKVVMAFMDHRSRFEYEV